VQVITIKFKDEFKFRFRNKIITPFPPEKDGSALTLDYLAATKDAALVNQAAKREFITIIPTFSGQNGESREEELDATKVRGEAKSKTILPDLNNFYSLVLPVPTQFSELSPILEALNELDTVEIAYKNQR
jgi:hypothetical protein